MSHVELQETLSSANSTLKNRDREKESKVIIDFSPTESGLLAVGKDVEEKKQKQKLELRLSQRFGSFLFNQKRAQIRNWSQQQTICKR